MKTVYWLFAVSAALFISGIAFIIAGERTARAATPAAATAAIETAPVATIKQIMIGITNPSAYVIYEAVGTKNTAKGIEEIAPQTDEDWAKVESAGAAVVESGNLILTGNRAIDKGDWVKMTHDMIEIMLVTVVLPAEFAIDPLGTGAKLGLLPLGVVGQQVDALNKQAGEAG